MSLLKQIPKLLPKLPDFYVDDIIKRALEEDINYIDVTSDLLLSPDNRTKAVIKSKADGILSGLEIAARVFSFDSWGSRIASVTVTPFIQDGEKLEVGTIICEISGSTCAILKAERTALNFLQHMSGIATYTRRCVDAISGTNARIVDTRKTLPGLRSLQKYAVLCGGGNNHRFNLSAAAMLKDNHIDAYGSITVAVQALRERAGHMIPVEVEVRDLEQLREAISAGANIILLDNMNADTMRQAVEITQRRAVLEASGNITLENIRETAETGIDIISLGALTHSVKAFDMSLVICNKESKCIN
ncbi:MAG: carboxylating nicotinate-nucleotide diphosphorylase [Oscillospiraceae bacterium]|nr:carboxylating nicotinate-nucleotide diphosphorylase [Oscillospiraceae bacterium]